MQKFYPLVFSLVIFFWFNSSAQNKYYVSENGNDNNNGLTPQTAFATLQHAADLVS